MANVITEKILQEITHMHRVKDMSWVAISRELKRTKNIKCACSTIRKTYLRSIEKPDIPRNALIVFDEARSKSLVYKKDVENISWLDLSELYNCTVRSAQSAYKRYKRNNPEPKKQPIAVNA